MAIKVKTQYSSNFNYPQSCVVCGNFPATETKEVSSSKSIGRTTTTLKLKFPLCQECFTASKASLIAKLVLVPGILVAIGSPLLGLNFFGFSGLYIGGIVSFLVILLLAWLSNLISQ